MDNYTYQLTYFETSDFAQTIHNQIEKDYPSASIIREQDGQTAVFIADIHRNFCEFYVRRNCRCGEREISDWAIEKANKIADAMPQLKTKRRV